MTPPDGILGFHARAFNAKDVETVESLADSRVRCIRDGELVGEGREAVRAFLQGEFGRSEEVVARVMDLDGTPVLVEFSDVPGHSEPIGILRVRGRGRVTELRADHDEAAIRRLAGSARARGAMPPEAGR